MQSEKIRDGQISASSQYSTKHAATQGRLHLNATGTLKGAWSAGKNDSHPWLQVYLGCESFIITRVATQGRNGCCPQWVTKYNLLYGDDKKNFQYYREQGESVKVTQKTPDILVLAFYFKVAIILKAYYFSSSCLCLLMFLFIYFILFIFYFLFYCSFLILYLIPFEYAYSIRPFVAYLVPIFQMSH